MTAMKKVLPALKVIRRGVRVHGFTVEHDERGWRFIKHGECVAAFRDSENMASYLALMMHKYDLTAKDLARLRAMQA